MCECVRSLAHITSNYSDPMIGAQWMCHTDFFYRFNIGAIFIVHSFISSLFFYSFSFSLLSSRPVDFFVIFFSNCISFRSFLTCDKSAIQHEIAHACKWLAMKYKERKKERKRKMKSYADWRGVCAIEMWKEQEHHSLLSISWEQITEANLIVIIISGFGSRSGCYIETL